jgi:two-component system chemotaxis response regulator CheY
MATILLIDDEPPIRRLARRILVSAGHEVIEAANGRDGLRQFAAHRPQIVVTDIFMPEKGGIETIKDLRRLAPSVWIVAISGGGAARNMTFLDGVKALGADYALAKPFRGDELIAAVEARKSRSGHPFRVT